MFKKGSVMYDKNNVFAKILRGEIPCDRKIFENEFAMSFYDISPQSEIHALVITKGEYENILDFSGNASDAEQLGFWRAFSETAKILGVSDNFNVWANSGADAPFIKQSVMHFHLHLVAGKRKVNIAELAGIQA
ncbi:histidine triad nucleotide-binding protein [Bacteroidia bacterium]|nr:histidine triad nucleotide-binding protein [Bacteroidia bacterium]